MSLSDDHRRGLASQDEGTEVVLFGGVDAKD